MMGSTKQHTKTFLVTDKAVQALPAAARSLAHGAEACKPGSVMVAPQSVSGLLGQSCPEEAEQGF